MSPVMSSKKMISQGTRGEVLVRLINLSVLKEDDYFSDLKTFPVISVNTLSAVYKGK